MSFHFPHQAQREGRAGREALEREGAEGDGPWRVDTMEGVITVVRSEGLTPQTRIMKE